MCTHVHVYMHSRDTYTGVADIYLYVYMRVLICLAQGCMFVITFVFLARSNQKKYSQKKKKKYHDT